MTSFGVHGKDYKGASVRNRRVDNIVDVYAFVDGFSSNDAHTEAKVLFNELYVLSNQ